MSRDKNRDTPKKTLTVFSPECATYCITTAGSLQYLFANDVSIPKLQRLAGMYSDVFINEYRHCGAVWWPITTDGGEWQATNVNSLERRVCVLVMIYILGVWLLHCIECIDSICIIVVNN